MSNIKEVTGFLQSALDDADALTAKNRILQSQIDSKKIDLANLNKQADELIEKKKNVQADILKERQDAINEISKRDAESKRILNFQTQEFQKFREMQSKFEDERGRFNGDRDEVNELIASLKTKVALVDSFIKEWNK